jgi:signal transduction histidine kinase
MICNLVEKGIKYTAGADRYVRIDTGLEGNLARVWVSDNGSGIAAEHLPHLFDRFYRVDKARTRNADDEAPEQSEASSGSGLGLAIAQWVVQAHGGEIRVESRLGEGTTFEVRFRALETEKRIKE